MIDVLYEKKTRLSDMALQNPNIVLILSRFDISLGFGDRTVAEVCRDSHVDADFFLLVCNVYSFNNYLPTLEQIKHTDMSQLVPYLKRSHDYYLKKRLPHIASHIENIAQAMPGRVAVALKAFVEGYRKDVDVHFAYEEQNVFPHIVSLQAGNPSKDYRISTYSSSHSDVEEKLADLLQIIAKYIPANAAKDDATGVIFDILQLLQDLRKHSLIEEKILVPYVTFLENSVK